MKLTHVMKRRAVIGSAAAFLLISANLTPAWAITGGQPDAGRHPNVCAVIAAHPVYGVLPFSGVLIHWIVPSHPIHALFQLLHAGLSPAHARGTTQRSWCLATGS